MPISRNLDKGFVHIPRTGGTSLARALNIHTEEYGAKHVPARSYRRTNPELSLISIVRHPLCRLWSVFRWLHTAPQHRGQPVAMAGSTFDEWLRNNLQAYDSDEFLRLSERAAALQATEDAVGSPFWFARQVDWLRGEGGRLLVSELYTTERIELAFRYYHVPYSHENATEAYALPALEGETRRAFLKHFEEDIALWRDVGQQQVPTDVVLNPTLYLRATLHWRGKDAGPRMLACGFDNDPELTRLVLELIARREITEISDSLRRRLSELELLVE